MKLNRFTQSGFACNFGFVVISLVNLIRNKQTMENKSRVFTLAFANTRADLKAREKRRQEIADFVAWSRKEKRTRERLEVAGVVVALPALIVLIALSIFVS
jgi:hypothetical protein